MYVSRPSPDLSFRARTMPRARNDESLCGRETETVSTTHHSPLSIHDSEGQSAVERWPDIFKTGGESRSRVPETGDLGLAAAQGWRADHAPILRAQTSSDKRR